MAIAAAQSYAKCPLPQQLLHITQLALSDAASDDLNGAAVTVSCAFTPSSQISLDPCEVEEQVCCCLSSSHCKLYLLADMLLVLHSDIVISKAMPEGL